MLYQLAPAGTSWSKVGQATHQNTDVGSVTIRTNRGYDLILSDVLHVPMMHLHILSTSALTLKGATVGFDHTGFAIRHSERTIVDGHRMEAYIGLWGTKY